MFVIDASVALAWCFKDEQSAATQQLLDRLHSESFFVPTIWPLECANALLAAERSRRIPVTELDKNFDFLIRLRPNIDQDADLARATIPLAQKHRLTIYDATYLELAIRMKAELATRDAALKSAAIASGTTLIPC